MRHIAIGIAAALGLGLGAAAAYEKDADKDEVKAEAEVTAEDLLAADVEMGAEGYAQDCSGCHATPARIMRGVEGDTPEEQALWLEGFLPDHYAPEAEMRAAIIAYMLAD